MLLCLPGASIGQSVYICNGIYRNKPCENGVQSQRKQLPPLNRYKSQEYHVPLSEKGSLGPDNPETFEKDSENPADEEKIDVEAEDKKGEFTASAPQIDAALAEVRGESNQRPVR